MNRYTDHPGYSAIANHIHFPDETSAEVYRIPFDVEPFSGQCWDHDSEGGGIEFSRATLIGYSCEDSDGTEWALSDLTAQDRKEIEDRFNWLLEHDQSTVDLVLDTINQADNY